MTISVPEKSFLWCRHGFMGEISGRFELLTTASIFIPCLHHRDAHLFLFNIIMTELNVI